jgi:hypothetical protein
MVVARIVPEAPGSPDEPAWPHDRKQDLALGNSLCNTFTKFAPGEIAVTSMNKP